MNSTADAPGSVPLERFDFGDIKGEVSSRYRPHPFEGELRRILDPAAAEATVHWDRNYLYRATLQTEDGALPVVVKQFRNKSLRDRTRQRRGEGKASRSWRAARAFQDAGIATAEPVMLAEPERADGASYFVTRLLPGALEARDLLAAVNAGQAQEQFPRIDFLAFLDSLGKALARMHDAGLFHRDLSIGNVLLLGADEGEGPVDTNRIAFVDLNRSRRRRRVSLRERTRDLCRLTIYDAEHQERFLRAYWGEVTPLRRWLYRFYHHSFRFKIDGKRKVRGKLRTLFDGLKPRAAHAHGHLPPPPAGAQSRDKAVWDRLSDQPHQHAGRMEKLRVRLADSGSHLRSAVTLAGAAPRIWARYRKLSSELGSDEVPWQGAGVCLRPDPEREEALLQAIDDLGLDKVLLRLHPWDEDHQDELKLARELHQRGLDLMYVLPQNRELVTDPQRWRRKIEELAELFLPYGHTFQIGQAINRSKWGIWRYGEYHELAGIAAEVLRRHDGVVLAGPGVIDFELHATAAVLNSSRTRCRFDALASLLYVDRRGAPENTQLGFDTRGKAILARAIAETARHCGPRSWITEVNWPLWEGPHSPAGKEVAVDLESQADYLARFYLLTLAPGLAERVYWWQLTARGYGLAYVDGDGKLQQRPAFQALRTLEDQLEGSVFVGPHTSPEHTWLYRFRRADGQELIAAWAMHDDLQATLPRPAVQVVSRDGEQAEPANDGCTVRLGPSVQYFLLSSAQLSL